MAKKKTRYAVVLDDDHKFVSANDGSGKIATTTIRKEAERTAKLMNGRVVDVEEWARNPRFQPQATTFQLFGPHGIELGLSSAGVAKITDVRVAKARFKRSRAGNRSIELIVEYTEKAP